jgi:hypothetical protein
MQLLPRARWILARHPVVYWASVAVVAVALGLQVTAAVGRVDAARRSWGTAVSVWVATDDVAAGDEIASSSRSVPQALVLEAAVAFDPEGSIARQHVSAGEIITSADVSATGPAGLIPDGWVAVPIAATVTPFSVGDPVAVFVADQRSSDGIVVDIVESGALVAVPEDSAGVLASAALSGSVTIALRPGPGFSTDGLVSD